jgi:tetratricopeptide (TPR) repeat protein
MNRRWLEMTLIVAAALGLLTGLRIDLADYFAAESWSLMLRRDLPGAERALNRSYDFGGERAPLLFHHGIAAYRSGKFAEAQRHFTKALTLAPPALQPALQFNLGNSAYRQAENLAGSDRTSAERLYRQAAQAYEKTLLQEPTATDAKVNLGLTRKHLFALEQKSSRNNPSATDRNLETKTPPADSSTHERTNATKEPMAQSKTAKSGAASNAKNADRPDPAARPGKSRRELSRQDAERMLNEARGREHPSGVLSGKNPEKSDNSPDKDW